eukprot:scaffold68838_cov57-Phaeocystis_antarctica.AAC.2
MICGERWAVGGERWRCARCARCASLLRLDLRREVRLGRAHRAGQADDRRARAAVAQVVQVDPVDGDLAGLAERAACPDGDGPRGGSNPTARAQCQHHVARALGDPGPRGRKRNGTSALDPSLGRGQKRSEPARMWRKTQL